MNVAGFDWLFIDIHKIYGFRYGSLDLHGGADWRKFSDCMSARFQNFHASPVLNGGDQGIVFPHVDDAKIATELVDFCCYSTDRCRSISGKFLSLDFELLSQKDAAVAINDAT